MLRLILSFVLAAAPAALAEGVTVVDDGAYWRCFYSYAPARISPATMKGEGEKCLGPKLLRLVERATKGRLQREGREADDWMSDVQLIGDSGQWSFNEAAIQIADRLRTDPAPPDWMAPDFDDTDWLRQCVPNLMGKFFRSNNMQVRQACFRTRFEVPDPAAAKGLVLRVRYRGGVRAFLNGREIARGHLRAPRAGEWSGDLAPDAPADEYPAAAYVQLDGEFPAADYEKAGYYAQYWQKVNGFVVAPELPDSFELLNIREGSGEHQSAGDPKEFRTQGNFSINRKGLARLQRDRDRRIDVAVDSSLLRKGINVLALEVRRSPMHPWATQWSKAYVRSCEWYHGAVLELTLAAAGGPRPATKRPAGVQVWAEDIHRRLYAADFHEPQRASRPARIVAARNGTFGAQVAVGTEHVLRNLKASVAPFKGLDASVAISYAVPHRVAELKDGDNGRRIGNSPSFDYPQVIAARYGSTEVPFFDHLTAEAPATIPADSATAVWVLVRVPRDAAPGLYRSAVRVEAEGTEPAEVPLELTVADWAAPDPRDFQTVMALEQSPYALANHYKVQLWSEVHWRLLDRAFQALGRVGNDWLNIPVLSYTEFGNREDSPVRLIRKQDGSLAADFAIADQYIDLAMKHCGRPRVVDFVVMHAAAPGDDRRRPPPMEVHVLDEVTGERQLLPVDHRMPEAQRREFWRFLSTAIHDHMKARGLGDEVFWGYLWDAIGCDPQMYEMLAEFVPGVGWAKGSHQGAPTGYYRAVATAYNSQVGIGFASRKGWKRTELWLAYPRYWGTIIDCSDYSTPFSYRLMMDRAIVAGSRGVGRMGLDYWGKTYLDGLKGAEYPVGVPNLFLLWPGPDGPETSIRFEVMVEGLQEAEARIFLEQALEKLDAAKHAEVVARTQVVLDDHNRGTLLDPPNASRYQLAESCALGWQERSRRLYAAAAEMAKAIGLDLDKSQLAVEVPARGKAEAIVRLRNWTRQPRAWKLASQSAWLRPERSEGTLKPGQEELRIALDGAALEKEEPLPPPDPRAKAPPPKRFRGVLALTDAESGRTEELEIIASLGNVFDLACPETVFNVTFGGKETQEVAVLNTSGAPLKWTASASVPWLSVEPAEGEAAPGRRATLKLTAAPPDRERARHEAVLAVTEAGGTRRELPLAVEVLPPYLSAARVPEGQAVLLEGLPVVRHRDSHDRKQPEFWTPQDRPKEKFTVGEEQREFAGGLIARPLHETVYSIEGKGFTGFAARVGPAGFLSSEVHMAFAYRLRLGFEVWVDGKLRAHSGLMGPTDGPRLLAVDGLEGAKEVRLLTRLHTDRDDRRMVGYWAEPVFLKKVSGL